MKDIPPYKSSSNFFSIKSNFLEEELLNGYLIFISFECDYFNFFYNFFFINDFGVLL